MRSSDFPSPFRPPLLIALLCSTVLVPGCTIEDEVVRDIGTTRLLLVDSDLATQAVTSDPQKFTIQVVRWRVARADLDLDGVVTDLTFGTECEVTTTPLSGAVTDPADTCASGIVISSGALPRPATLHLTLELLEIRRAEPVSLPVGGDHDGDGVPNETDNCPLIDNPDQRDTTMAGFGEACAVRNLFGTLDLDNDRDRIIDRVDNCPHLSNPGQEDAGILVGTTRIPDAIGDVCTEQSATVRLGGSVTIDLVLGPVDLLQPLLRTTFLTVDLRSAHSLDRANCGWETGAGCELDPAQVGFCILQSGFGAACPL